MKKPTLREALNTDKASGPPPRQQAAPPRPADLHLHLPGPPSRHTTTRKRATTPHDSVTRSPSCTEQTARRPRPSRQHPGPPPRPKSQTISSETSQPSRQPHRTGDTRLSPKPCKQPAPRNCCPPWFPRPLPRHPQTTTADNHQLPQVPPIGADSKSEAPRSE
jgi:hypothetical protein